MLAKMLSAALFALAVPQGDVTYPPRPGPREFVLDEAKLLPAAAVAEVRQLCDAALTQKQVPIVVVTIESLAAHGAGGWPIERYAMNLMGEWGIGWPEWNYGMLLLVSPGDRKVRIELGGSWARRQDDAADRVLRQAVLPQFKQGRFDAGIVAGVRELQAMALRLGASATAPAAEPHRDATPPVLHVPNSPSVPGTGGTSCGLLSLPVILGIVGLMFLSRIGGGRVAPWGGGGGFYGRRRGGFGSGLGGGLVGGALGSLLYNSMMNHANRGHRSGGGGGSFGGGSFGGGSFGGGFSGGGGATGSW